MKSNENANFPVEIGIMGGFVLVWTGQFFTALLAGALWLILHRIRKNASSDVLLVASVLISGFLMVTIFVVLGYVGARAAMNDEVQGAVVTMVALVLFFKESPATAYFLIAYSTYIIVVRIMDLHNFAYTEAQQHGVWGAIALKILIIWTLVSFLRKRALTQSDAKQESPPIPPGPAAK